MRGEFRHGIDAKGRLIFPARLRDSLGENFIVAKGLDNCLFVYSSKAWAEFEEMIRKQPLAKSRKMQRFFCASAAECEPDVQGRILIPQNLRDYAGITKEVTIVGLQGRAEIWDTDRWNEYNSDMTSDAIAEAMEEMGV